MAKLYMNVPDELHRSLRLKAAEEGTTITAIVIPLIKDAVAHNKPQTAGGKVK